MKRFKMLEGKNFLFKYSNEEEGDWTLLRATFDQIKETPIDRSLEETVKTAKKYQDIFKNRGHNSAPVVFYMKAISWFVKEAKLSNDEVFAAWFQRICDDRLTYYKYAADLGDI